MSSLGGLNSSCTADPYFIKVSGGSSGLRQIRRKIELLQGLGGGHNILVILQHCSGEPLKVLSSYYPSIPKLL